MSKQEILEILKLLSQLEAWSFVEKHRLPDYLIERLDDQIIMLTERVLGE